MVYCFFIIEEPIFTEEKSNMQSCYQGISPVSLRTILADAELFGADDFVMLNALDRTNACRTAMDASTAWINRKNQIRDS